MDLVDSEVRLSGIEPEPVSITIQDEKSPDALLPLLGEKRILVVKTTDQRKNDVLRQLKLLSGKKKLGFEVIGGQSLSAEDIRGEWRVVTVGGHPMSKRLNPSYWPEGNQRKLIVVDGLSSDAETAVLRAFLHVACRGGIPSNSELMEEKLPEGSGFVFLAEDGFPLDRISSMTSHWREEAAVLDEAQVLAQEATESDITTNSDIEKLVWNAVRKTINKFRDNPYYFFTESDIITHCCQSLYCSKLEIVKDDQRIYCIHRDYPANFRYEEEKLLSPDFQPCAGDGPGIRGSYDLAVLNPKFVEKQGIAGVLMKHVQEFEARIVTDEAAIKDELLFAIEFKYTTSNDRAFETEILKDNKKLECAKRYGAITAINVVLCNNSFPNVKRFRAATLSANPEVTSIFVQSYHAGEQKRSPRPVMNTDDQELLRFLGARNA